MSIEEQEASKPIIAVRIITVVSLLAFFPLLIAGFKTASIVVIGIVFIGGEIGREQTFTKNPTE